MSLMRAKESETKTKGSSRVSVSATALISKLTEARMQQAAVRARLYAELRKALYGEDGEPVID
jgi:hypothetical protein